MLRSNGGSPTPSTVAPYYPASTPSSSTSYPFASMGVDSHAKSSSSFASLFRGVGPIAVQRRYIWIFLLMFACSVAVNVFFLGQVQALQLTLKLLLPTSAIDSTNGQSSTELLHTPLNQQKADSIRPFEIQPASVDSTQSGKASRNSNPIATLKAEVANAANSKAATDAAAATPSGALPPPPLFNENVLTQADIDKLEEPWRWFESSGEHKDLLDKVRALRAAKGSPLLILDIGLNIGSAPWAIERVCPDCVVFGFEPIPKYFAFAKHKMPQDRYPNIHLYNYAICDEVGNKSIWMDVQSNVGWNTLIAAEKTASQVEVPIVCVTVDRLKSAGVIPAGAIDFIKIDTEGAEHMVMQGMKQTIISHPVPKPWMYIEVGWGRNRKDWDKELAAFQILFDNGYEQYDMNKITGTSMHWMTPKGL